jgi:energy-coupling factor transporter ATP-binding protein EcfA2
MLTIARALMMKPTLLILDEPTLGLAPVILEQISKALERLRQTTPITVLLGEQNVTFALPHADRVDVLEHARIVWEGDPAKFAAEAGTGYLQVPMPGLSMARAQASQACTAVWRTILPSAMSSMAEQKTLVPFG